MNKTVYLMDLCPSHNCILPKQSQWSYKQPLENFRMNGPGILEEIANMHADRQTDKFVNYSKIQL